MSARQKLVCFEIWEWLKAHFSFDESKFCTLKNVGKCVILHMVVKQENWISSEAAESAPDSPRINSSTGIYINE